MIMKCLVENIPRISSAHDVFVNLRPLNIFPSLCLSLYYEFYLRPANENTTIISTFLYLNLFLNKYSYI